MEVNETVTAVEGEVEAATTTETKKTKTNSHANRIEKVEVMISGLTKNQAELAFRGITPEYIAEFDAKKLVVIGINNEQESIKAQLKVKTNELNGEMALLMKEYGDNRAIVKRAIPSENWKEFGIKVTR
ncbi:MAG: hypothetical protein GY940_04175 [bacterium]|nr:hypothetical protein [bacterium]